ncbi:MAG: hypothetical protein JXR31_00225 [Prolixibacteraceae bacterium]|nr:hypothetical protein [Prolixibacteraceae bacterium]
MKVRKIVELVNASVMCGDEYLERDVRYAFSSDLMSDILTLETDELIIVTGLSNIQLIRTAEMVDVKIILIARNKKATPEMIELAKRNNMVVLESPFSIFRVSGELYKAGVEPVY